MLFSLYLVLGKNIIYFTVTDLVKNKNRLKGLSSRPKPHTRNYAVMARDYDIYHNYVVVYDRIFTLAN